MPTVRDLTPKFRFESTQEKERKKELEVETLFWYIKASFIVLFINYEYFCSFQGTSVMLLLNTGVRSLSGKNVKFSCLFRKVCVQSRWNSIRLVRFHAEVFIFGLFFCYNFWAQKYDFFLINCRLWKKIDLVTWTKFASFEYKWNWKAYHALLHNCQEQFFTRLKRFKTKVSKNCTSSSSIWIEFHGFTVLLREDAMLLTREYIRARFLKTHCAY